MLSGSSSLGDDVAVSVGFGDFILTIVHDCAGDSQGQEGSTEPKDILSFDKLHVASSTESNSSSGSHGE